VLATFFFSFTNYNIVQPPTWIGLENWQTMFTADSNLWIAAGNTAHYAALAVPLGQLIALFLALLLSARMRGMGLYRTLYYLPSLAPPVAATMVFLLLFSPQQAWSTTSSRRSGCRPPGGSPTRSGPSRRWS
jgi:multiple sugar transport system permease protein